MIRTFSIFLVIKKSNKQIKKTKGTIKSKVVGLKNRTYINMNHIIKLFKRYDMCLANIAAQVKLKIDKNIDQDGTIAVIG